MSEDAAASGQADALRQELARIDELPVEERVARLEQVNETLARQLAELDELTSG